MPIYEYECGECRHRLEKLQKVSDPPATLCPACEKPTLTKLVSVVGFRLKGGGWYETDFKQAGKKNISATDAPGKDDAAPGKDEASGKSGDPDKSGTSAKSDTGDAGTGNRQKEQTPAGKGGEASAA